MALVIVFAIYYGVFRFCFVRVAMDYKPMQLLPSVC
jgi:hypothetical protein